MINKAKNPLFRVLAWLIVAGIPLTIYLFLPDFARFPLLHYSVYNFTLPIILLIIFGTYIFGLVMALNQLFNLEFSSRFWAIAFVIASPVVTFYGFLFVGNYFGLISFIILVLGIFVGYRLPSDFDNRIKFFGFAAALLSLFLFAFVNILILLSNNYSSLGFEQKCGNSEIVSKVVVMSPPNYYKIQDGQYLLVKTKFISEKEGYQFICD